MNPIFSFLQNFLNSVIDTFRVSAQATIQGPPTTINAPMDVVNRILPIVYAFVGVGVFGYFIYGGYTWLMSAGDPDKVNKAKDTMINAAIGAVIVVFAYVATRIVSGILGFSLV